MGSFAISEKRAPNGASVTSPNKSGTDFWHQGYGMIRDQTGTWVVPFLTERTARLIAKSATHKTKIPMQVLYLKWLDCWGYRPRNKTEMKKK